MTPTRKGLYDLCLDCKFKIKESQLKYPCEFSHKTIRVNSNSNLEREFHTCGKKELIS